jgi:hypothetical protein
LNAGAANDKTPRPYSQPRDAVSCIDFQILFCFHHHILAGSRYRYCSIKRNGAFEEWVVDAGTFEQNG